MPATPTRIAFVKQEYRSSVQSDQAIRDRYGSVARDTQEQPVPTFFESMDDVAALNAARFALLKADRRRFDVTVAQLMDFSGGLSFMQVAPPVSLIDDEKSAAGISCIVTSIEALDFESDSTRLAVWG
jgi:hypothetical protein